MTRPDHKGTMNKATLIEDFKFKKMLPKIEAVKMMTSVGCDILPIIDTVAKTLTSGTYISHHKFSVYIEKGAWDRMTEPAALGLGLECLKCCCDVPEDMFSGEMYCWKTGGYGYKNEYQTSVRMWSTKRVGNRMVYEFSVIGYKGGIPRSQTPPKILHIVYPTPPKVDSP